MALKVRFILIALFTLSLAASVARADSTRCSGSWEVSVRDNGSLQQSSAGPVTWLQAEVVLEEQLSGCIDYLVVGPGNSVHWWLESSRQSLRVEPYDSRRNPLHIAEDGRGWILPLQGVGLVQSFLLRVDHPEMTRPGLFQGVIQSEAWTTRHSRQPIAQKSSLLDFLVEPFVSIYFNDHRRGGAGSYLHVDLGELRTGASREVDMFIHSNSDVVIELESKNRGVLTHNMDTNLSIPYDFNLDSRDLDLRRPQTLNVAWRPQGNWRVPMRISVPYVSPTARAGEYSDTISIDIYPRE